MIEDDLPWHRPAANGHAMVQQHPIWYSLRCDRVGLHDDWPIDGARRGCGRLVVRSPNAGHYVGCLLSDTKALPLPTAHRARALKQIGEAPEPATQPSNPRYPGLLDIAAERLAATGPDDRIDCAGYLRSGPAHLHPVALVTSPSFTSSTRCHQETPASTSPHLMPNVVTLGGPTLSVMVDSSFVKQ
jgi:hypothetical protein